MRRTFFAIPLFFSIFLFTGIPAALADCCLCHPKDSPTTNLCLTDSANTCDKIIGANVSNKNLDGVVCDKKLDDATQCAKITSGSASAICSIGPISAASYTAGNQNTIQAPTPAINIQQNVSIPGLVYATALFSENGTVSIPYLAQYISAVFAFLIGVGIIAAAVMVVYGGFKYVLSATVQGVKSGKETIVDALTGLVALIAGVTILQVINPATAFPEALKVQSVKYEPFAVEHVGKESGLTAPDGTPLPPGADGLPNYPTKDLSSTNSTFPGKDKDGQCNPVVGVDAWKMTQYDLPWGIEPAGPLPVCSKTKIYAKDDCALKNKIHGNPSPAYKSPNCDVTEYEFYGNSANDPCCMTYADSACGASSAAVVLNAYGTGATPGILGNLIIRNHERVCNAYGLAPTAAAVQKAYPTFSFNDNLPRNQVDAELRKGHPIVFLSNGCTVEAWKINGRTPTTKLGSKTWGSHYMVLTGIYDNGDYGIDDVGRNVDNLISKKELDRGCARFYLIKPKDDSPIKACQSL